MNWTPEDLAALDKAIASGAKRIEYKDHVVEYKSLAEMLAARKIIEAQLSLVVIPRGGRIYASVSKGVR